MPDALIPALLRSWSSNRDYAQRLVADLSDADMVSQPIPGVTMNHPAWTIGHLSAYPPVLCAIVESRPFEDPLMSPYGRDTRPTSDPDAYPNKADLMRGFLTGHDALAAALEHAEPAVLAAPIPLARWKDRFPRIADALVHLMLSHESTHLGQISAWRRAGGRPAV